LAIIVLKTLILFAILAIGVFSLGFASVAEAHPHATVDLMDMHSHDLHSDEDFVVHAFEQVVLFVGQIQSLIFG
jgi:hypothetical protein